MFSLCPGLALALLTQPSPATPPLCIHRGKVKDQSRVDSDPGADTQKLPHNIKPELSHLASKTSLVSWAGSTVYGLPPKVRISWNLPVPPGDRVSSAPQPCPLQAKHRGRYSEGRRLIPENSFGFESLPPRTRPVPLAFRFHPCTLAGHKSKPEPPRRCI